jgi:hypothetical protein
VTPEVRGDKRFYQLDIRPARVFQDSIFLPYFLNSGLMWLGEWGDANSVLTDPDNILAALDRRASSRRKAG